jgi:cytochrome P450
VGKALPVAAASCDLAGPSICIFGSTFYKFGRYATGRHQDPAPISPRQLWVLAWAMGRAFTWIWPAASQELEHWHERASRIPDERLREDALSSLTVKRENALGAALFCILPKRRKPHLLTLLVAYQTLWDYLDNVSERAAFAGSGNGVRLHSALVEALDPDVPISDHYRHNPWSDDGGYLYELVGTCQRCCRALPSYRNIRPLVLEGVRQCSLQGINHLPERRRRERELKTWAEQRNPRDHSLRWFEITAAASAFLPHPLLSLAAEPAQDMLQVAQVHTAYNPWMALSIAMLDSHVDAADDQRTGNHSYIAHYEDQQVMCERLREVLVRTLDGLRGLQKGRRHLLMAASMTAMYLSVGAHGDPQALASTRQIAVGAGSFTRAPPNEREAVRAHAKVAKASLPGMVPLPAPIQTFMFWSAPFQYLHHCRNWYGSIFTLKATSHPPLTFLSEPREIRSLMAASDDVLRAGEGGANVSPIVGERSFMLSDGAEHRIGRKKVLATFHAQVVERHANVIAEAAERAVSAWPTDTAVALHPRLRVLTLDVVLRTLTGRFTGQLDDATRTLRNRVLEMLQVTASPVLVEPHLRHGPGRRTWNRFLRARARVDELLAELIDETGQSPQVSGGLLGELATLRNTDGSQQSPGQVRDNAMSVILAGHETTAAQLAWAFQLLAHNPKVRDRLHAEIDAGPSDEYLTATIQEVLRHRCVFLFAIPRAVAKPIEIGSYIHRPPGHLLACIYLLHHDPAIYPDPHTFRPERFLESPPDPHNWIPWGGGRKRCPGLHLAMFEMKTILRTVLSERTVQPASKHMERPRWRSVIVTPHAGARVIFRERHH